jgi:hypothetical protein
LTFSSVRFGNLLTIELVLHTSSTTGLEKAEDGLTVVLVGQAPGNGGKVQVSQILMEIDNEIARLQQARDLLAGGSAKVVKRGRPPAKKRAAKTPTKRKLSPEGRRKIAEAMKRRWAERRKEIAAKQAKASKA